MKNFDFDAFKAKFHLLVPEDFEHTAEVLRRIEEIEHNANYIAPEIYDPRQELKFSLGFILNEDNVWSDPLLGILEQL